jgi:uncharacterized membrane protein HdeD (DUF308 family)
MTTGETVALARRNWKRVARGLLVLAMGAASLAAPWFAGPVMLYLVGFFLIVAGLLEMLETFQTPDDAGRRASYLGGALSILAGLLLQNQPRMVLHGLAVVLAGTFLLDAFAKGSAAWRSGRAGQRWVGPALRAILNIAMALVLLTGWPVSGLAVLAVMMGIRMLSSGADLLLRALQPAAEAEATRILDAHPDRRLGLDPHPEFGRQVAALDRDLAIINRQSAYWCVVFVLLFFAIHVGRMSVDWNLVGFAGPFVAALGDMATAMVIAYGLVLPYRLCWRWATRPLERRLWPGVLARIDTNTKLSLRQRLCNHWLCRRLGFSWRMGLARASLRSSLGWALQIGLPLTAILIALNPVWGFSWYFNSENWASEVWNRWAEARTDAWRANMIAAIDEAYADVPADHRYRVEPEGVQNGDFTFLVIGDPGEGDPSQHCLRDRYLALGSRPDVKFFVISSDVIYPAGAMTDYEFKFYLPYKGVTRPIYAIPGNHDWFDALEAFAANFLEPKAARAAMRARVETDARLTTTNEHRIDRYIGEAARLRKEFAVQTGLQRGPFFEIQTDAFALLAVDTGIMRTVDPAQLAWLKGALERSRGKFVMAILGHPFYAGGRYQGENDEPFADLHRLLQEHNVPLVMAGDTHYFEYYREAKTERAMHHFVNGGGGAYISIGTPLDWPRRPAVSECGYFPRRADVVDKLDRTTPLWKQPLWLWTKHLRAWPFTAETMSGAFDYNHAPYWQSFVEVRVEKSRNRVRLIPHGANGPLKWRELDAFGPLRSADKKDDEDVEFVIEMK